MPGLPTPEQPESGSLPADDRFGLEDHQSCFPIGPRAFEQQPKAPIPSPEPGFVGLSFEDGDLVPEG
jgi:hypothetical protein